MKYSCEKYNIGAVAHTAQTFTPALVNLADLDRMRGLNQEGVELLRKAMEIDPNSADIHHSLGLALVRQHNYADAIPELRFLADYIISTSGFDFRQAHRVREGQRAGMGRGVIDGPDGCA
jgi:tetratricopeptide (TPR) repeat protein